MRRDEVDKEVRFLSAVPQGRLLDLGCGSGLWLMAMRELGWRVDGVDFDPRAVAAAAEQGLAVRCGSLEQQNFPKASFDAITMSHVIEHLPNPVQTLQECARILKPGGRLILWTPNASSLGHRVLKQYWRGLEPPRHLHLFSPPAMRALLKQGGLSRISIRTRNSTYNWRQGFMLWARQRATPSGIGVKLGAKFGPSVMALLEGVLLVAGADSGEWLDVRASSG